MTGGTALCIWGELSRRRSHPKQIFIAFRHQSLEPFEDRLSPADLPPEFKDREIREVECDQSIYLTRGSCDPAGAVRQEVEKLIELRAMRKSFSNEPVGYYGLAHVPLQFLAGCRMSTHASIYLFELDRRTSKWRLLQTRGPHLGLEVNTMEQPANAQAVAVRICISYEVTRNDIAEVLPFPFEDIRIGLPLRELTPSIRANRSMKSVVVFVEYWTNFMAESTNRRPCTSFTRAPHRSGSVSAGRSAAEFT
jgi:hypothetical protein